jgi:hypothetical protein
MAGLAGVIGSSICLATMMNNRCCSCCLEVEVARTRSHHLPLLSHLARRHVVQRCNSVIRLTDVRVAGVILLRGCQGPLNERSWHQFLKPSMRPSDGGCGT